MRLTPYEDNLTVFLIAPAKWNTFWRAALFPIMGGEKDELAVSTGPGTVSDG